MQFDSILTSIALSLLLALGLATSSLAQNRDTAAGDAVVLDMADAHRKADRKRLGSLLPQLRGHPLEPWGIYWEQRARLDESSVAQVQATLQRLAGTYQEDRLRNDWLHQLGLRREWATFNTEYPKFRMQDDRSVRCYALMSEFNSGNTDVAGQVQEFWLAQRDAEDGCAAAAEQQLKAGRLKPHAAWLRARIGMENDRPRVVAQALGLLNPEWAARAGSIHTNPARYLDEKITALLPRTKELVTLALIRLAAEDPEAAAAELNKLRWKTQLTQEERSWVWGVIGKRAAQRLSDKAMGWFENGQDKYMHEDHLAWKVRAALRAGMWPQVLEAIQAMSEQQRRDPAWVYWRARALLAPGRNEADRQEATRLLESIASVRGFYEQLALEDLGRTISVPERPQRWCARMELQRRPARQGRHGRPRIARRRRPRLPARALGPLHQHQRSHPQRHRLRAALPDAAPRRGRAPRRRDPARPGLCVRPDPPGKPLRHRCPLLGRRLGPDAGDAGHSPLDCEEDRPDRLHARPDHRPRHQHRHRHGVPAAGAR
jgi:soluble lytic murein transglycosylase